MRLSTGNGLVGVRVCVGGEYGAYAPPRDILKGEISVSRLNYAKNMTPDHFDRYKLSPFQAVVLHPRFCYVYACTTRDGPRAPCVPVAVGARQASDEEDG